MVSAKEWSLVMVDVDGPAKTVLVETDAANTEPACCWLIKDDENGNETEADCGDLW